MTESPTWYQALRELGLPTVLTLALLAVLVRWQDAEREDRRAVLGRLTAAVEHQGELLQVESANLAALAREERDHADAIRVTWPRIRETR